MRIAVVGVGLIGGSIALAARERMGAHVAGWDPDAAALAEAQQRGALDEVAEGPAAVVREAQAVFVAAPVGALPAALDAVLRAAPPDCVVSDVGSTKRSVLAGRDDQRLVGGHPLAGAESAGVAHARGDLFDGATWYLTPTPRSSGRLYQRLHRLLAELGARPTAIDPEAHDRLMASVSHLPHVLANVLVGQAAAALRDEGERLPATGPSFRDATRVAGANSAIWPDIYLANREALLAGLDDATARLGAFRAWLQAGDRPAITAWNDSARQDRQALLEVELAGGPVQELRASVPNRPGVIAQLALALGRAGVNIVDMALSPAPDEREGVVALWLRGDGHAQRAGELIEGLGFPVTRP